MEKEIEINVKVKIFDNPDYCEDELNYCFFLDTEWSCCSLLNESLLRDNSYVVCFIPLIKCDECKKLYKQAKEDK